MYNFHTIFIFHCLMNLLRLVAAEKDKKSVTNPSFEKLKMDASCKDKGDCAIKFPKEKLQETLSPIQFHVTQEKGTEKPFSGEFLNHKEEGVYTCVVCDNPLFMSDQKYETNCGWPSFKDIIAQGKVTVTQDTSHGMIRQEVTCSHCGAHLGHVFDDGPEPLGLRYCINSASLNFKHKKSYKEEL